MNNQVSYFKNGQRISDEEALDSRGIMKTGVSMRVAMTALDEMQRSIALDSQYREARKAADAARQAMIDEGAVAYDASRRVTTVRDPMGRVTTTIVTTTGNDQP